VSFVLNHGYPGNILVQGKEFYGPRDLISDALAGAVAAGKEFKVLKSVIVSNAVNVMDRLFFEERSAKMLFHYVSVLKNLLAFSRRAEFASDVNSHVAVSGFMTGNGNRPNPGVFKLLMIGATRRAAEVGLSVKGAVRSSSDRNIGSTHFAGSFSNIFVRPSSCIATWHAAVERILPVFSSVRSQFTRILVERLSAVFARELNRNDIWARSSVSSFVSPIANGTAVLSNLSGFGLKFLATVNACFVKKRHSLSPVITTKGQCETFGNNASSIFEGAE
jgi:hypothetical protein